MNKYYEVSVLHTGKPVGSKEDYTTFDDSEKTFFTIKEVKEHLSVTYSKCKRVKMFVDTKDGKTKHTGYIYCFKNNDISHDSKMWYQQDWVSINEIQSTPIII